MVFSSVLFLFIFLPIVLIGYVVLPTLTLRNLFLLAASLFFYAWGEVFFVGVMIASILTNYAFGLAIDRFRGRSLAGGLLAAAVIVNLGLLAFYKYANFIVDSINALLSPVGVSPIDLDPVHLPIGISFFTFQALSYVIDVYRDEAPVQKSPLRIALFVSLFPQLIAGPIVRYHDIAKQLSDRSVSLDDFTYGVQRFTIGLGKKVLIANTVALPADQIFALPNESLTPGVAWLGALCYTLQIYFDFSGYSDMAIGLGRMFGVRCLENFNDPYIAQSIQEFWRRWHISLSSWFRDYLYIPLGGNRGSAFRTYFNLVTVFFLCGLWHGASWTFVVLGLYHGLFLVIERLGWANVIGKAPRPLRHLYALIVAIVGWVFFRAETFGQAAAFLAAMMGLQGTSENGMDVRLYLSNTVLVAMVLGAIGSAPLFPTLGRRFAKATRSTSLMKALPLQVIAVSFCLSVLVMSILRLSASSHNPFIYFRF